MALIVIASLALSGCQATQTAQAQPSSSDFNPVSVTAPDCTQGNRIRAITAVDQYTVKFTLCEPDRTFPAKVGAPAFSIQDDAVLSETQGDPVKISQIANGTGPFSIVDTSIIKQIRLERREDYWGTPVRLRSITLQWNGDSKFRRTNLSVRSVDGISSVNPNDVNSIRLDSYLQVVEAPVVSTVFVGMNNTIAPFDSLVIRQALATAFDHQKLALDFFGPSAAPASQLVPPYFDIGHTSSLRWYDFDTRKTNEQLTAAGFDFTQELVLSYDETPSDLIPEPSLVASELAAELKSAGVKVKLKPLASAEFQRAWMAGELGLYLATFKPDYPDANSFFETFFLQDNPMIGKTDAAIAEEIQTIMTSNDPSIIQASADVINNSVKQSVILIPLVHTNEVLGFRSAVGSIIAGPFGENFSSMTIAGQNLTFMQSNPASDLWPVNFSTTDAGRTARLVYDTLTTYDLTGVGVLPGLADSWSSNASMTEWTFMLRYDVAFSNGALLDANDVVATFAAQADAGNPNHRPEVNYDYYRRFFGNFLNAQP
jgi:ABC-type transport system substrate-binding protein